MSALTLPRLPAPRHAARYPAAADGAWRRLPAVPVAAALLVAALCGLEGWAGYASYHAGAYDLGFFDQVVENTAAGHPFATSFLSHSFLGQHWEPVLALWAPLDRLAPSALWLVGVQAVALAAAPVFAWRLARAWTGSDLVAAVAAAACVLDPLVTSAAAFPYHTEALTPALALAALDGAARGQRLRFLLPALALLTVKEDAVLVAGGVGWIAWTADRRRAGLWLCGGMLATFAALTGYVMPRLRDGAPGDLSSRYAYLGGPDLPAMLAGAVTHPERWLRRLAGGPAVRGLAVALLPLALLPLRAVRVLPAVAPALLVALLSADGDQASLSLHYGLEVFPLLLAAALLGMRALPRPRLSALAAGGCLVAAATIGLVLPSGRTLDLSAWHGLGRSSAVAAVLRTIPDGVAVSATTGLVPHLSARAQVYEFPDRADQEPYVAVDAWGPHASWTEAAGWRAQAAALARHGYHVVASAAGVTVWAR